ncbi:MAG: hypothetical protein ACOCWG_01045 [bacterium]
MKEIFKILSNREISIIIWAIIIFGTLIISSKGGFRNLFAVIKSLFIKHFIPFYVIFGLYFFLIIYFLNQISIWEYQLYKDFIYWLFTIGIVLFFNSNNLKSYKDFSKVILTATSATIILEFIIGFYNFPLVWELILLPVVTIIAIFSYFVEMEKNDQNNTRISKFLKNFLSVIGIGIFIFTTYQLIVSYNDFFTLSNLKSFMLPPIFTLLFLPLIYLTVIYMKYERTFRNLNRYKFLSNDRKNKIKYSIIIYANVDLNYLDKANKIILFNKENLLNESDIKSYIRENIKL